MLPWPDLPDKRQWALGLDLKFIASFTTVRLRNPVNIDDFRCLAVVWWVEVEQEPVKRAFSQKA